MGLSVSDETRKKMSKSHSGKVFSVAHKRALSEANVGKHNHVGSNHPSWGKKYTLEERQRMSQRLTGMFAGKKNPRFGVVVSDETRRKISESLKRRAIKKRDVQH